ncbi:hypothetical protein LCGC14_0361430, partial [marine sediment metagenome]
HVDTDKFDQLVSGLRTQVLELKSGGDVR